jgi:peptide/nickel transport system ATP-binding protein
VNAIDGPILEVSHLGVELQQGEHHTTLVEDVSFSIEAGRTLGIVGESGSGKSLTALAILRLLSPGLRQATGVVKLMGQDLGQLNQRDLREVRRSNMSAIFQDPLSSLNPTFTVGNQLIETIRLRSPELSRKEATSEAVDSLHRVGIPSPRDRLSFYPWQLSGGMAQRVMIALAVAGGPRLLVADEPTTALDASLQLQILSLLEDMRDEFNMSMLLISHDLSVIAQLADDVVVVYAGQAIEQGKTADILVQPLHPYTEALLRTRPQGATKGKPLVAIEGRVPRGSDVLPGCHFAPRCRFATEICAEAPVTWSVVGDRGVRCLRSPELSLNPSRPLDAVKDNAPISISEGISGQPRDSSSAGGASEVADVLMRFSGVSKIYGKGPRSSGHLRHGSFYAVHDAYFEVGPGETLGIVGESGAGKSTIGRIATGLTEASDGTVEFLGTDVARLANPRRPIDIRREIQIVFQNPYGSLDPLMTIGDSIGEPIQAFGGGDQHQREALVADLLDQVGLDSSFAGRFPAELSGGERQRVAIARALAPKPRLIVCDEPVSSLDVSMQAQIVNLLQRLQEDNGMSYLFISHDLALVHHLSHRIAVMYNGYVVEVSSAGQVYANPQHPYTQSLIKSQIPFNALRDLKTVKRKPTEIVLDEGPPSPGCPFAPKCPHATAICLAEMPPIQSTGPGSSVRCHWVTASNAIAVPVSLTRSAATIR